MLELFLFWKDYLFMEAIITIKEKFLINFAIERFQNIQRSNFPHGIWLMLRTINSPLVRFTATQIELKMINYL